MGGDSQLGPEEYLGHQLLLRLQESMGKVPRSVFFKTWCITDRYLEREHGVPLNLPRYWFKYGELVHEKSLPNDEFYFVQSGPWSGRSYHPVYALDFDSFNLGNVDKRALDNAVDWAISRFGGRDTEQVKSYQYLVYAPNEFIRTYSELRDYLEYTKLGQQAPLTRFPNYDSNEEVVEHLLDQMVIAFPEEEFGEMYTLYLRWDDTARLMLEQGPDYSEFEDFLEEFIEALSEAIIRLKHNQNIPDSRLEKWKDNREEVKSDFEADLSERRSRHLSKRKPSGLLNQVSKTYDETVLEDMERQFSADTE